MIQELGPVAGPMTGLPILQAILSAVTHEGGPGRRHRLAGRVGLAPGRPRSGAALQEAEERPATVSTLQTPTGEKEGKMSRMSIEQLAQIAYDAGAGLARVWGGSDRFWEDAPNKHHASIKATRFLLTHPDADAAMMHDELYMSGRLDGWTRGANYDPEAKISPHFLSFEECSGRAKDLDNLFVVIVRALQHLVIDIERSPAHGDIEQ